MPPVRCHRLARRPKTCARPPTPTRAPSKAVVVRGGRGRRVAALGRGRPTARDGGRYHSLALRRRGQRAAGSDRAAPCTSWASRRQRRTLGVTERRCRADGQRLRSLIGGCTCGACPHKQVLCRGVHAVVAGESARSESVHDRSSIWVLRPDELRKRVPEADQSAAWAERH